jgi:ornithine cyclodeaminase/alanine dehydrogenase-like protein (mu-crystallin family)
MGLFGSSTQAATQALYHAAILKQLSEIRVYSTNAARRKEFAEAMSVKTGIRVVAVDHPREAVEGCHIVTTATNSNEPVFSGEWLEPGAHVNTMIGSDAFLARRETDEVTIKRSDIIVVNSKESIRLDKQPELYPLLQRGVLSWDDIYEVSDLLIGDRIHGRSSGYQITYHNNNVGMGIQFAALGRLVYEKARALGRGTLVEGGVFVQMPDDLRRIRERAFLGKGAESGT